MYKDIWNERGKYVDVGCLVTIVKIGVIVLQEY